MPERLRDTIELIHGCLQIGTLNDNSAKAMLIEKLGMDDLLTQIEYYKKICRLSQVPQHIIDNPSLVNGENPEQEVDDWKAKINQEQERRKQAKPTLTHTRKITFEILDEHPVEGDYCVFGNETAEETDVNTLDFAYVSEMREIDGEMFLRSPDLKAPVMQKFCWKLKMRVHD